LDSSCSAEEGPPQVPKPGGGQPTSAARPRSRNVFLPSSLDEEEEEEEEDGDGDNLHRYCEDSSFVLHGNFNWAVSHGIRHSGSAQGKRPLVSATESSADRLPSQTGRLDSPRTEQPGVTESAALSSYTRVQDLNSKTGFNFGQLRRGDSFPVNPTESASDSSCNSSDGVLVNFCTIYSKSNNPATPQDPGGCPAPPQPAPLHDGSVFLNLQPVRPRSPSRRPEHEAPSPPEQREVVVEAVVPSAPCWSPQALDSNCNLYSLEPWSSLELSDLTACLQGRLTLAMGTNQKYYKLVSCEPPSKTPSPAWPGLGRSFPGGPHAAGPVPSSGYVPVGEGGLQRDRKESDDSSRYSRSGVGCTKCECYNYQDDCPLCKTTTRWDYTQSPCSASSEACPVQSAFSLGPSAAVARGREVKAVPTQPSGTPQPGERSGTQENGACSWAPPVLRYTKAQRPTSLPIQPFILLPPSKPQAQHLGSLLDQYVSQRGSCGSGCSGSGSGSRPGSGCKAAAHQLLPRFQPSPSSGYGRILLEAPSSSDTCSTCSPSPDRYGLRQAWGHSGRGAVGPCRSQGSQGPYSGAAPSDFMFKLHSPRSFITPQTQPSLLVETPTSHYLIDLTPEPTPGVRRRSAMKPETPGFTQPGSTHSTPPTLACTSLTQQSGLLSSLSAPPQRAPRLKPSGIRFPCSPFSEPFSSSIPRTTSSSQWEVSVTGPGGGEERQEQNQSGPCEPLMLLSDRPPAEFCLSPSEASYESLSISHLQRRGLLRSVSSAMDLIMAHFGSSRDPEEKMRLGNSRSSPTIAGLVLEHLCPAIQNILEDGLRHHKLDVVIGQQRNHSWRVVDASTQRGRASRMLLNLVSKITQCSQLTNSCMKLRAFLMGLLNLRSLEFWLSHLQSQNDVVSAYYHSWAFMTTTQSQCQPLFQELLLLLQPLSVLPFDLNLLLESRHGEPCSNPSPITPCSTLLMTTWPKLQAEIPRGTGTRSQQTGSLYQTDLHLPGLSQEPQSFPPQWGRGSHAKARDDSPQPRPHPGWWIRQPVIVDGVIEEEDCRSAEKYSAWSQQYHAPGLEGALDGEDAMTGPSRRSSTDPHIRAEGPTHGGLRWAKLFGAVVDPPGRGAKGLRGSQCRRNTRPSQWLQLPSSTFGQLAQSVWAVKFGKPKTD
ncbi:AP-4 complex accessory subunit RUSC2-like, partial [Gadus chalcogrammus]|uniref:AP-4 complex accessory subunit RUSC2-like n=1 Tax=Gadus chalcogrammus TaxID=1042646 RepID=UPI0024C42F1F